MNLVIPILAFAFLMLLLTAVDRMINRRDWHYAGVGASASLAALVFILHLMSMMK
jgi:hypothetical protein